ncbi:DUF6893 family small protein [Streptomyces bambusae]
MKKTVVGGVLAVSFVAVLARLLPDLKRYLRIRRI